MVLENMEREIMGNSILLPNKEATAVIVVDMINGFVRVGPLSSDRVEGIVPNIESVLGEYNTCEKLFFVDEHIEGCTEFESYPSHCLKGTHESEIIDELLIYSQMESSTVIAKNSTNGFFAPGFSEWLNGLSNIDTFIVIGCVTDICISQLALSLKTYFNERNISKDIVIPIDCVETFDGGSHDANVMNIVSLFNLKNNGIVVIDSLL